MNKVPDIHLIKRYQSGDIRAFEEILQIEGARIAGFVRRYLRDMEYSQDIFQEICVCLWQSRSLLKSPQAFRYWMFQIARSRIYEHLRNKEWKLDVSYFEDWDEISGLNDHSPNPREVSERKQWRNIINNEIMKLDSSSQEMLLLRVAGDLTLREISKVLNIPHGTVCTRMARALKKIKESLEAKGINKFTLGL